MKQKVYCLLTLAGLICLIHQAGYAQKRGIKKTTSSVSDTTQAIQKITVSVKDLASSKLLDSVQVTLGKEQKYTTNGVVFFENKTNDSLLVFNKPGYYKTFRKVSAEKIFVSMLKTKADDSEGGFVVTSLYRTPQLSFSGSAIKVTGDDIRKINTLNFLDALKYYVPSLNVIKSNTNGSNPNALPEVRLRGVNNFPFNVTNNNSTAAPTLSAADFTSSNTSSGTPVILLDGIQVSLQTALDIDMYRILDVTILKDASATAAYGMRGGNGVISIQTIKPKGGLNISITEQVNIASADLSSYQLLNAKEKLDLETQAGLFNSSLDPVFLRRYNQAYNNGINTDWLSVPLRTGVGMKHALALSSGNDDVTYGLNASFNNIEGSMKGSNRKNTELGAYFGGRFGSFYFNNQFSYLGTNASNSPYGAFSDYAKQNAYWNPYDSFTGKMQKILEADTIGGIITNYLNPAFNATLATTNAAKYSRLSNTTNLNWIIGSGFQLNGVVGLNKQSDQLDYFLPPNHTSFGVISAENMLTRGAYQSTENSFFNVEGRVNLQYQNQFGKHAVQANIGENIMQTSSEASALTVTGFTIDRLADIAFGNGYSTLKPPTGKIVNRYASTFGRFAYSYDNRFQLDFSGTLDFYSGLGNNAPTKSGAIGISWNIQNEKFLSTIKWINLLKVRGSLGTIGNQDFLSYLNRTTYNYYTNKQYIPAGSGASTVGVGLGAYLTGYGNHNLQSPKTFKQNVGLDAVFLSNRLAVSFDVFKQKTTGLIMPDISLPSTGFLNYSYYQNYGAIESNGFEFSTMGTVYKSKKDNINWNIVVNGLYNRDKVNNIAPFIESVNNSSNIGNQQNIQPQYQVGYAPSSIWAVPSLGLDPQTGKEIFVKKDGTTTNTWDANDKVFAGNLTPSWLGSFGTDVTFRQFSVGMYFNYQLGAKVYNYTKADIENADINYNVNHDVAFAQRWTSGTAALYKSLSVLFTDPTDVTTRFVEKNNKVQCATMMLGYAFPKMITDKIKTQNMSLKLIVNNAFEFGGANMEQGINYPFQRNYTISLNANF